MDKWMYKYIKMFSKVKKYLFLILAIIVLVSFILLTYFYWAPDTLISFVPADNLFYLHLNLNKFCHAGHSGFKWLNNHWPQEVFDNFAKSNSDLAIIGANFPKELIPLLDEVGLIGLTVDNSSEINLIFILKAKKSVAELPLVLAGPEEEQFFSQKIGPHIWALASSSEILKSIQQRTLESGNKNKFLFIPSGKVWAWGRVYINLEQLNGFLQSEDWRSKEPGQYREILSELNEKVKNKFVKLNISPWRQNLIFDLDSFVPIDWRLASQTSLSLTQGLKFITPETAAVFWNLDLGIFSSQIILETAYPNLVLLAKPIDENTALNFVFIFAKSESLDNMEDRIKTNLAVQKPIEEKVSLPDSSSFVELLVNPAAFVFEKKEINGTEIRFLIDPEKDIEIALSQNEKNTFVSNRLTWIEETLRNYQLSDGSVNVGKIDQSFLRECLGKNFSSALYWRIKKSGLNDLAAIVKGNRIRGCLNFSE